MTTLTLWLCDALKTIAYVIGTSIVLGLGLIAFSMKYACAQELTDWQLIKFVTARQVVFAVPGLPDSMTRVRVLLRGVTVPRLVKPRCRAEFERAILALQFTIDALRAGHTIAVVDPNWGARAAVVVADIHIDGQSLAADLVDAVLAKPYSATNWNWCGPPGAPPVAVDPAPAIPAPE